MVEYYGEGGESGCMGSGFIHGMEILFLLFLVPHPPPPPLPVLSMPLSISFTSSPSQSLLSPDCHNNTFLAVRAATGGGKEDYIYAQFYKTDSFPIDASQLYFKEYYDMTKVSWYSFTGRGGEQGIP